MENGNTMYFTKDHGMVRRAVSDFIKKELNPHVDQWEEDGIAPLKDIFKKMGDLGFLGIRYDPQYGGQGLDYWYDTVFLEELDHIQALGLSVAITVQTHMATPAIAEFGSDFLKDTYLKAAIAGEMIGAIAVTEPGAGSDVAAIRTTAKKDNGDYVINGSKMYITNGTQADFYTLLARTGDEPGYHSFSLFIVPSDLAGVTLGRKLDKLGIRISDTAELFFDNVRVPAQNMIGKEGEGFVYQMMQFQHERFSLLPFAIYLNPYTLYHIPCLSPCAQVMPAAVCLIPCTLNLLPFIDWKEKSCELRSILPRRFRKTDPCRRGA